MEISRQEYWRGLPVPTPGDLSNPRTEPASLASLALADGFFTTVPLGERLYNGYNERNESQNSSK